MQITPRMESWLEMRGIACSTDEGFRRMVPWSTLTFGLCGGMTAIATAFALTPLLAVMVVIAGLGAISPRHPFDAIYNYGIRSVTGTQALPPNAAPTRFACGLASVWLVAMIVAFEGGAAWLGYALGVGIVSVAALVTFTHFCIPSFIYQTVFGDRSLARKALRGGS